MKKRRKFSGHWFELDSVWTGPNNAKYVYARVDKIRNKQKRLCRLMEVSPYHWQIWIGPYRK